MKLQTTRQPQSIWTKIWHWTIVVWVLFLGAVILARFSTVDNDQQPSIQQPATHVVASGSDLTILESPSQDTSSAVRIPEPVDGIQPVEATEPITLAIAVQDSTLDAMRADLESLFPEEVRNMLAQTVYGEAGLPWLSPAERSMVIWCILNRYDSGEPWFSDGYDDIAHIITKANQFQGYTPDTLISEYNRRLVDDVIDRYIAEKLGVADVGRTLPNDICYFQGDGQHNTFFRLSDDWLTGVKLYFGSTPLCDPYTEDTNRAA